MESDWDMGLGENLADVWNFTVITVDQNDITLGTLFVGLMLFSFGALASKLISHRLRKQLLCRWVPERSAQHSLESLTFYLLLAFFSVFALKMANIPLSVFTVVGGALAIGVGFGSQNIVNNFISGIILMLERPIKVGDYIEVDGQLGEVQSIAMRSTRILAMGNRHIMVPNSSFLEKNVLNWTLENRFVRGRVDVGVSYGSDVEKVRELLTLAASTVSAKGKEKDIRVFFNDFGDNALSFSVVFWVDFISLPAKMGLESDLRFCIYKLFGDAGIVIAFPQRDVHLYPAAPLKVEWTKEL